MTATPITALASSLVQRLTERRPNQHHRPMILIREEDIRTILTAARDVFLSQPMLLEVLAPVNIGGDIHGQFHDLLRVYEKCGYPPYPTYLWLGDYVDRGSQGVESIMLQLCYKVLYPVNFFLLRGNHECASINKVYGFFDEVKRRYNVRLFKAFTDVFNTMPVACIVAEKIICMHGGLSPDLTSVGLIAELPRLRDIPDSGLLCDILWSDPADNVVGFIPSDRGVGFLFGTNVVNEFLDMVDMDLIVRAHQVMERGYGFFADRRLVTIFTATNYCGEFDNDGGILLVDENRVCSVQIIPHTPFR